MARANLFFTLKSGKQRKIELYFRCLTFIYFFSVSYAKEIATLPFPFNFSHALFLKNSFWFIFSPSLSRCVSTFKHSLLHSLLLLSTIRRIMTKCVQFIKKRIYAAEKIFRIFFLFFNFCSRNICATANKKKREKKLRWTMIFYVRWCSGWISALARDDLKIYFLHLQITRDTSTLFSYCVLNCVLITALCRTILRATDSEFSD